MKIFGIEIGKGKLPTPKDVGLIDAVEEFATVCNNQLRGVTNTKAQEYNYETLEYYMGLAIQKGIEIGIRYQEQNDLNNIIEAQDAIK